MSTRSGPWRSLLVPLAAAARCRSPQAARKPARLSPSAPAPAAPQQRPAAVRVRRASIDPALDLCSVSTFAHSPAISWLSAGGWRSRLASPSDVAPVAVGAAAAGMTCMCCGSPAEPHPGARAGQPLALRLVGVRHQHGQRARRRRGGRPSASRCRGRPRPRPCPRRRAGAARRLLDRLRPRASPGARRRGSARPAPTPSVGARTVEPAVEPQLRRRRPSTRHDLPGHQVRDADEAGDEVGARAARRPPRARRPARSRRGS